MAVATILQFVEFLVNSNEFVCFCRICLQTGCCDVHVLCHKLVLMSDTKSTNWRFIMQMY